MVFVLMADGRVTNDEFWQQNGCGNDGKDPLLVGFHPQSNIRF